MNLSVWYEIGAILLFVLANGFFALSEFSIIASRKSRLAEKIEEGKPGAEAAARLHAEPDQFLATIQLGITLFATLAGVFGGATLVAGLNELLREIPIDGIKSITGGVSVVIVTVAITVTSVILGELVPKYLALSNPERYARYVAPPVSGFMLLTSVISKGLSGLANMIVRLLGVRQNVERQSVSEEEINLMIFEGKQRGVFDEVEEQLIQSVFDFADSTVKRAMTPRTDVVGIDVSYPTEKILEIITSHGYSRYPVYEDSIDTIVGILYTKDLIYQKLDPRLVVFKDLIRKAFFVPDSLPLSKLLEQFQRRRVHVAIVLDEYGGTAGVITVEDILEELVGEIRDEYDEEESPLVKHSETTVYASGDVWPGDVNKMMDSDLPEDDIETLSGMLMEQLGRLPARNEKIRVADMDITVLTVRGRRLLRLRLDKVKADNGSPA